MTPPSGKQNPTVGSAAGSKRQPENNDFEKLEAERQTFSVVRRAVERTRLTVEGGAQVSVADVLSKLNAALAEYGKGELSVAVSQVQAAAGLYQDKLNRWENLVRQREEAVKQRSVQKFRQVQAVHNPVRTNTRQIPASFRHLIDCLNDRIKKEGHG